MNSLPPLTPATVPVNVPTALIAPLTRLKPVMVIDPVAGAPVPTCCEGQELPGALCFKPDIRKGSEGRHLRSPNCSQQVG